MSRQFLRVFITVINLLFESIQQSNFIIAIVGLALLYMVKNITYRLFSLGKE